MNSLEKSEVVIAKILSLLMEWGIAQCDLKYEELELDETYANYFFPCIEWLVNEGVIRTGEIHRYIDTSSSGVIVNPVLTSYGFQVLGRKVGVGEGDEALSSAIRKVSNDEKSYSQVGDFFGGLLGGFTKSIGS